MPTGDTGSVRDSCVCSLSVCQASMTTVRSGVNTWHLCTYPQCSFCGADGLQAFLCSYSLQPYHCSLQMFSFQQLSEWIVANLWATAIYQRDSSISKKDPSHTKSVQAQDTIAESQDALLGIREEGDKAASTGTQKLAFLLTGCTRSVRTVLQIFRT